MFLSSCHAVSFSHNMAALSHSACRARAGFLLTGCHPEPPVRSREGNRRCSKRVGEGTQRPQLRGLGWHCEILLPVGGGMRGITRSDFLLLKFQRSLFPSAFPPAAEATAREGKFARVTLGPKQMERTCCKHFTRHGPDSCSMPPSPADSSLDHPVHRVPR